MIGVFIDSNVFIKILEGDAQAKTILNKLMRDYNLYKNSIVFSEVVIRALTGKKPYDLKRKGFEIDYNIFEKIVRLLNLAGTLPLNKEIEMSAIEIMQRYKLLPNGFDSCYL